MNKHALNFNEMMCGKISSPRIDLIGIDSLLKQIEIPVSRQALRKKIGSLCPISDETFLLLNCAFQSTFLSPQEVFCSPEQIPSKILFVQKGMLRGYFKGEKQEVTTWFARENEFIIPNNFFSQEPGQEYIQCMENCTLLSLDYQSSIKLLLASNEIAKLFLKLMEEKQQQTNARERMLRIPNAERRFQRLIKEMPGLQQNVKDEILSSYLNVTRRHLERIKVQCFKKP